MLTADKLQPQTHWSTLVKHCLGLVNLFNAELFLTLVKHCFGLVNLFNAELSPTRYWWGPRSQQVGEEGDYT